MNRRDLLLAVLAASAGQSYQPVQLQKAMFLVTRNLPGVVDEGPGFEFVPYDYGPFDASVYQEADRLERAGLAEIGTAPSGRWRVYAASAQGIREGDRALGRMTKEQRAYVRAVSQWVRRLDFGTLVRSVYEAYPEMRANSIFQG